VIGGKFWALLGDSATAKRLAVAAVSMAFIVNVLALVQPVFMLHVYDYVLPSQSGSTLFFLTLIALFLVAMSAVIDGLKSRFLQEFAWQVDVQLRERAFLGAYHRGLVTRRFGQAQFASDLETIKAFIAGPGLSAFMDLPWTPVFMIALLLLSPWLAGLCLLFAIIVLVLAYVGERQTRGLSMEASIRQRRGGRFAEDIFLAVDAVEAMGFSKHVLARWSKDAQEGAAYMRAAGAKGGLTGSTVKGLRIALQVLLLAVAAGLALTGTITPGAMIAASIIGARALAPVDQAVAAYRSITAARESWAQIQGLVSEADQTAARPHTVLPTPKGALRLERIDVVDPVERVAIIQGVSLEVPAGSVLALVGPSGSGKTTLARVVAGAIDQYNGAVIIDGADSRQRARDLLGAQTGYVPQMPRLLSGTVSENIRRFGPVDDEGVIEAAKRAGAHEIIVGLKDGYDTDVGDAGRRLSGGQAAAVSLARALYNDPALIVLDEPFAYVDSVGEAATLRAVVEARARGRTVVMVVHRPSHLGCADFIAVMSKGRLMRFGPAKELRDLIAPQGPAQGSAAA
jgi:ATP-binding cassette subfamily C exporter for protease/lipase